MIILSPPPHIRTTNALSQEEVAAIVEEKVGTHDNDESAHADIRDIISSHISSVSNPHGVTAAQLKSGTLATGVVATIGTDYTTSRLRNIKASTADLTAGTSSLANGCIYLVYE